MGMLDEIIGGVENAGRMVSGAVAQPLSGLYGAYKTLRGGADAGAQGVRDAQEALTYQPRTAAGQRQGQAIGEFMEPVTQTLEGTRRTLGDAGYKLAGPAGAAALSTLPEIAMMGAGRVAQGVTQGIKNGNHLLPGPTNTQRGHFTPYSTDVAGTPNGVGRPIPNLADIPPHRIEYAKLPDEGVPMRQFLDGRAEVQGGVTQNTALNGDVYGNGALLNMRLRRAGTNGPIPAQHVNSQMYAHGGDVYVNPDRFPSVTPRTADIARESTHRNFNDTTQQAYNQRMKVPEDSPLAQQARTLNNARDNSFFTNLFQRKREVAAAPTATIGVRG